MMYVIRDLNTGEYLLNRTKRAIHNVHPFGRTGAVRTFSSVAKAARSAAFKRSVGRSLEVVQATVVEAPRTIREVALQV